MGKLARVTSAASLAFVIASDWTLAFAEPPIGCDPAPTWQRLDDSRPINLGQLRLQLVYYRCTRYDADLSRVLRKARSWVERQAVRVTNPALVLDIDETSLSNWKQLYQNDFAYIRSGACDFNPGSACGQIAWEKSASAVAIQPTLELFNAAKSKGVAVFFITGRAEEPEERIATETNLRNEGYDGWAHLYMRITRFEGPSVAPFKTWARTDIETQGFTIIANVGDQESDLSNGHAQRRFKVPNPFYYIR